MIDTLRAVCPRCRRLARAGTCSVDGETTLVLRDAAQRERMVERVWGDAAQRQALRASQAKRLDPQRAAVGSVTGALTFGASYIGTGNGLLSLIVGGVTGLLGAAVAVARPLVLIPTPASPLPAWPRVGLGKVVHGEELLAPGSATPCVAWAVELRNAGPWGTRTVFRAGATLGMDIVMDGGDHVRIPAGALWLDGPLAQLDGEERTIDDLVEDVDPGGADSEWTLFPFNIIMEQHLDEGDRVEVLGVVEPRPVANDDMRLYRDAPTTELVHAGLPVLRRA